MSTTQETTELPSSSEGTNVKVTGQVKWFNKKAGYGFITVCDTENTGKDIFVHYSSLKVNNTQYRYLVQGEYVEFNLVKLDGEKYEFHAVDVSGIKGGPIMCESIRTNLDNQPERQYQKRTSRPPRGHPSENQVKITPRRRSTVEESAQGVSGGDDPPGFEKVVKKRQPRTKPAQ